VSRLSISAQDGQTVARRLLHDVKMAPSGIESMSTVCRCDPSGFFDDDLPGEPDRTRHPAAAWTWSRHPLAPSVVSVKQSLNGAANDGATSLNWGSP
jgi:hypothetical protein